MRVINRILNDEGYLLASPTHINHAGTVISGVNDSGGGVIVLHARTAAEGEPGANCHERAMPRHTGDADAVIRHRTGDTGDMCAVSGLIDRFIVAFNEIAFSLHIRRVGEIPAMHIVNVTVAVVVKAVVRHLAGVHPRLRRQIVVPIIDARIDDGDDDVRAALLNCPCLWQSCQREVPLLRIPRVIWINHFSFAPPRLLQRWPEIIKRNCLNEWTFGVNGFDCLQIYVRREA